MILGHLLVYITMTTSLRVIICPGNGCTSNIRRANFYGRAESLLKQAGLFAQVILEVMPDPNGAKESVWVPHLLSLGANENAILIGHSSGAEAAMRLLENNKLFGAVLVSACHTDLGEPSERAAGYYSRPWDWERIKNNVDPRFGIIQIHSRDDPFIPTHEAEHVAAALGSQFTMFDDRSHFFDATSIDDVLDQVIAKVRAL